MPLKLIFETPAHKNWVGNLVPRHQKTVKARKVRFDTDQENLFSGDHCYNVIIDADTQGVIAWQYEPGADWVIPVDPFNPGGGEGTCFERFRIESVE